MADLTLGGTTSSQPVTDAATIQPFAAVTVTSAGATTPYATATVALSTTANGALSHLGIGTLSADGSTYTVKGSPADVQAALRGLVFTPVAHEVPVGRAVTTGFTLTASDAAGAVTDTRTSVVATAADTPPTVTDTSATQAPTSTTTTGVAGDPGRTSFAPFTYTTITDPDAGATETTSIALTQNGAASDAVGLLSGAGLTKTGVGTYALAAGTSAAETEALEALRFTPANPGVAASLGVTLTVSDGAGSPVAFTSTLGLAANPGGQTVVSNSNEALTNYNDTVASNATHAYATTIEAVLNGATVLYDQTFALPYSDPRVQAAVAMANAALQNAAASPSAPTQTASNLTTLSSQTNATETGQSTAPGVISVSSTLGLPAYLGPNVSIADGANTEANRGYFYILAGQTDTNVDTQTTTTVSRTVTTTSTDLLSQQYLVTGTSTAMAASTTTLVSSSAAGVEGDSTSSGVTNDGRPVFTADGASVLFKSAADNIVTPDALGAGGNATYDLFLKTLSSGAVVRVDATAAGVQANADVLFGSISGDGSSVVFDTKATNLDVRATDGTDHVYEKGVATGVLTLVAPSDYVLHNAATGALETIASNLELTAPAASANGRYVAAVAADPSRSDAVGELVVFDTLTHTAVDLTGTTLTTVGRRPSRRRGRRWPSTPARTSWRRTPRATRTPTASTPTTPPAGRSRSPAPPPRASRPTRPATRPASRRTARRWRSRASPPTSPPATPTPRPTSM